MKVRFIVIRPNSGGAESVAVVNADVVPAHTDYRAFLRALKKAVTNWALHAESGKAAWKRSAEDFNVGDLSMCLADPDLTLNLKNQGIYSLDIEAFDCAHSCQDWTYDTVLVED